MRDSTLITITTLNGSKQYTLTQLIKKFILGFGILFLFFVVAICFSVRYLNALVDEKTKQIEAKNQELIKKTNKISYLLSQKNVLQMKVSALKNEIAQKQKLLNSVNDKIDDIERIIQFEPPKNVTYTQRLDLAKIDLVNKKMVLNSIPNGYPVVYTGISSKFGWRIHPILHKREFHTGLDLRAKLHTPVYATADGIVEYAHYHKRSGYGNLLIIDHNFGFKTMFGHLSKFVVHQGDFVRKGQLIAYTGNSGLSSGPHLHYEIRYLGIVLNPIYFIKWNLKDYNYIFKKERKVKWQSLIRAIQWQKKLIQQQ